MTLTRQIQHAQARQIPDLVAFENANLIDPPEAELADGGYTEDDYWDNYWRDV